MVVVVLVESDDDDDHQDVDEGAFAAGDIGPGHLAAINGRVAPPTLVA